MGVRSVRKRSGKAYDPTVADRFCQLASTLFDGLEGEATWDQVLSEEPGARPQLSEGELDEALRAFADFTDLKSSYTVGHSSSVADRAAAAAKLCGLSQDEIRLGWRSGLVHDIGRVAVSAGVWGKKGSLTQAEWERVRMHPYYTERILARPYLLKQLGALAGLHHERLDGSGYHRGTGADTQLLVARILAAADTYQSKIEWRPHRDAFTPKAAADALQAEVHSGRLDGQAVSAVLASAGHRTRTTRRRWPTGLSDREVEVIRWIASGMTNREIGKHLVISTKTVGHHVQHVYDKIGTSTRAAATLFAMQHDLIDDTEPPSEE